MTTNAYDILKERGFIAQVTDEEAVRQKFAAERVTFYIALTVPPTASTPAVWSLLWLYAPATGRASPDWPGGGRHHHGGRPQRPDRAAQDAQRGDHPEFGRKIHAQLNRYLHFDEGSAIAANNADWLLASIMSLFCGRLAATSALTAC
jgi:tyrosyl-tRNA synthetase